MFLQNVFRLTPRSQHRCHRGMRRTLMTGMASFRRRQWEIDAVPIVLLDRHESHPILLTARDAKLPTPINLTRDWLRVRFREQERPLHKHS